MWKWLLDEWWRLHGYSAPHLQKLVIQILSQTTSSSRCERNLSVFEHIHTKIRNRLEHQRLNELVCIHYNLRLKNRYKCFLSCFEFKFFSFTIMNNYMLFFFRFYNKKKNLTIDYACIDEINYWIVEEHKPVKLDVGQFQ